MYQFIERSLRGAFHITQKYSNSIKKYVNSLDEKKRSKFIIYEYANNLYGWKMSENLLFLRYFGSHKMNMIVFM